MNVPDIFLIDGKMYTSVEEMPPEARAQWEAMQKAFADENADGAPAVLQDTADSAPAVMTPQEEPTVSRSALPPASNNLGPVIVLGIVSIGLVIIVGIILFLVLNKT